MAMRGLQWKQLARRIRHGWAPCHRWKLRGDRRDRGHRRDALVGWKCCGRSQYWGNRDGRPNILDGRDIDRCRWIGGHSRRR